MRAWVTASENSKEYNLIATAKNSANKLKTPDDNLTALIKAITPQSEDLSFYVSIERALSSAEYNHKQPRALYKVLRLLGLLESLSLRILQLIWYEQVSNDLSLPKAYVILL